MPERPYRLRELHDHLVRSNGRPCPERDSQPQGSRPGTTGPGSLCQHCGRLTARRDQDGRPDCAGRYDPPWMVCRRCGHDIDPAATAGGYDTHPGCEATP